MASWDDLSWLSWGSSQSQQPGGWPGAVLGSQSVPGLAGASAPRPAPAVPAAGALLAPVAGPPPVPRATLPGPPVAFRPLPVSAPFRSGPTPPPEGGLTLEAYTELYTLLTKSVGGVVQPACGPEENLYKLGDLKALLALHGLSGQSRSKRDVLDRMVGMRLWCPFASVGRGAAATLDECAEALAASDDRDRGRPASELAQPLELKQEEVDQILTGLGWELGPDVDDAVVGDEPAAAAGAAAEALPSAAPAVLTAAQAAFLEAACAALPADERLLPSRTVIAGLAAAAGTSAEAVADHFRARALSQLRSPQALSLELARERERERELAAGDCEGDADLDALAPEATEQNQIETSELDGAFADELAAMEKPDAVELPAEGVDGPPPEPPAWLAAAVNAQISGGVRPASASAAALDSSSCNAPWPPGRTKLGQRVACVFVSDFCARGGGSASGRDVDWLDRGVHVGRVVAAVAAAHPPDLCEPGCTAAHELYYVRFAPSRSSRVGPAPALDMKVDLAERLRCPTWERLLEVGAACASDRDQHQHVAGAVESDADAMMMMIDLQDAWVLLEPAASPTAPESQQVGPIGGQLGIRMASAHAAMVVPAGPACMAPVSTATAATHALAHAAAAGGHLKLTLGQLPGAPAASGMQTYAGAGPHALAPSGAAELFEADGTEADTQQPAHTLQDSETRRLANVNESYDSRTGPSVIAESPGSAYMPPAPPPPEPPAWLAAAVNAQISGGVRPASASAAALDSSSCNAPWPPGRTKLGQRVACVFVSDFCARGGGSASGRDVDWLDRGVHVGRVVAAVAAAHPPDLCEPGCTAAHELYYVRFAPSRSSRVGPAPALDMKVDLAERLRCPTWERLLEVGAASTRTNALNQDAVLLEEAWVLLASGAVDGASAVGGAPGPLLIAATCTCTLQAPAPIIPPALPSRSSPQPALSSFGNRPASSSVGALPAADLVARSGGMGLGPLPAAAAAALSNPLSTLSLFAGTAGARMPGSRAAIRATAGGHAGRRARFGSLADIAALRQLAGGAAAPAGRGTIAGVPRAPRTTAAVPRDPFTFELDEGPSADVCAMAQGPPMAETPRSAAAPAPAPAADRDASESERSTLAGAGAGGWHSKRRRS